MFRPAFRPGRFKRRFELKKVIPFIIGVSLIFSGCFLEGGLGHGKSAQAEITPSSPRLDETLPDAESRLLQAGIPVEGGFRCEEIKLKSAGFTAIEASASGGFDPVIAVVDKEGSVLAVNDDWGRHTGSMIVLSEVPSGARLLVWGINGAHGSSMITVNQATQSDLDQWIAAATLQKGVMEARLLDGKENLVMQDFVDDLDAPDIYVAKWENAMLVPFSVSAPGFHEIYLGSDDFDAYMALVSLERGKAEYVAMNDDGGSGWDSRLVLELDPGLYGVVVNSYGGSQGGRFTLSVNPVEVGTGEIVPVTVPGYADGYISGDEIALSFWPGMDDDWHYSSINTTTPVSAFQFTVEEPGLYSVTATSDIDATMTLLSYESPEDAYFVDYNDDYDGFDPGFLIELEPGAYLALVAAYDQYSPGAVTFSIEMEVPFTPEPVTLEPGETHTLRLDRRANHGLYLLDIVGGYNYGITADSEDVDPMITLTFADGSELFDDDGGEGLNSYLEFIPGPDQLGPGELRVETYWGDGTGTVTVSFFQLERLSESEIFSLYD